MLVSAIIGSASANRDVLRACLENRVRPLVSEPLFLEYQDVLARAQLIDRSPLSVMNDDVCGRHFSVSANGWTSTSDRANLRDEHNNHLIELAVAGADKFALAQHDEEVRFRARAARGIGKMGWLCWDKAGSVVGGHKRSSKRFAAVAHRKARVPTFAYLGNIGPINIGDGRPSTV